MSHVLIIEDNRILGCELSRRLAGMGFDSFDHVWNEEDAIAVANMRPPDLLLVGDSLESGDPLTAARKICARHDVPALLITGDSLKMMQNLPEGAFLQGPYAIGEMDDAIHVAQKSEKAPQVR